MSGVATFPLDTKQITSITATGSQITSDPDTDFADALAGDAQLYVMVFRAGSGETVHIGAAGRGSGGDGDYAECFKVTDSQVNWPTYVRRDDLSKFYAYAATSSTLNVHLHKVN